LGLAIHFGRNRSSGIFPEGDIERGGGKRGNRRKQFRLQSQKQRPIAAVNSDRSRLAEFEPLRAARDQNSSLHGRSEEEESAPVHKNAQPGPSATAGDR
jgi:hypothetical protein